MKLEVMDLLFDKVGVRSNQLHKFACHLSLNGIFKFCIDQIKFCFASFLTKMSSIIASPKLQNFPLLQREESIFSYYYSISYWINFVMWTFQVGLCFWEKVVMTSKQQVQMNWEVLAITRRITRNDSGICIESLILEQFSHF